MAAKTTAPAHRSSGGRAAWVRMPKPKRRAARDRAEEAPTARSCGRGSTNENQSSQLARSTVTPPSPLRRAVRSAGVPSTPAPSRNNARSASTSAVAEGIASAPATT